MRIKEGLTTEGQWDDAGFFNGRPSENGIKGITTYTFVHLIAKKLDFEKYEMKSAKTKPKQYVFEIDKSKSTG